MVGSSEFENHFRDDVLLDLIGSAEDRQFAHVEVGGSRRRSVVGYRVLTFELAFQFFRQQGQGVGAQRLAHQMGDGLTYLGAPNLEDGALGPRYAAFGG